MRISSSPLVGDHRHDAVDLSPGQFLGRGIGGDSSTQDHHRAVPLDLFLFGNVEGFHAGHGGLDELGPLCGHVRGLKLSHLGHVVAQVDHVYLARLQAGFIQLALEFFQQNPGFAAGNHQPVQALFLDSLPQAAQSGRQAGERLDSDPCHRFVGGQVLFQGVQIHQGRDALAAFTEDDPDLLLVAHDKSLLSYLPGAAILTLGTPLTLSKRRAIAPVGHTVTQEPQATQASDGTMYGEPIFL